LTRGRASPPPAGRGVAFLPGSPRPLRIAHRGASARAPENTLEAFEEARRLGAQAIEIDVHLSADGLPVVIHDETLERTTDGRGRVDALPLRALRRLDAGSWFGSRFRAARVPTLEETFDWAGGRIGVNVEIKIPSPRRGALASPAAAPRERIRVVGAVARALARLRSLEQVIVSSFDPEALAQARQAMPRVPLGLLASRSIAGLLSLHRRIDLHAFHPHHRLASPRRIGMAHRNGLLVLVWPVNDPPLMRRLVDRGADGLMTDDPALFDRL
jgi:glycerophosphoryl diester phosphodiesterase